MKNSQTGFLSTVIIIILALALGAFGFWFYENKISKYNIVLEEKTNENKEEIKPIAEEKEEIIIENTEEEILATPEAVVQEDLQAIFAQLFADKYNRNASESIVTISKQDSSHVSGGIKFASDIAGGWFLGAKDNGKWLIVQDGNGTISCQETDPYDFPVNMVPECWDEVSNEMVKK